MGSWGSKQSLNQQVQRKQDAQIVNPSQIEDAKDLEKKVDSKPPDDSKVDPPLQLLDPIPDIHEMLATFNQKFFWSKLKGVSVVWNKRMTYCAGICLYCRRRKKSIIALSEPLLKLRPKKDLVDTLLHEMIHAYLFAMDNGETRRGHGPEFLEHMNRINSEAGTNISVYHNFHNEVKLYRRYTWRCNGPCQTREPFFGIVKREENKAPGPSDGWWSKHLSKCGGTFIKVKEPLKDVIRSTINFQNATYQVHNKTTKSKNDGNSIEQNIEEFKDKDCKIGAKSNSSSTELVKTDSSLVEQEPVEKTDVSSRTGDTSNSQSVESRDSRIYRVAWNDKIIEIDSRKRSIIISYHPSYIPKKKQKVDIGNPSSSSSNL